MPLDDSTASRPECVISDGFVPYERAVSAMRARIAAIRNGQARELVWLLQHPALYTAGTSAQRADLADPDRFETFEAGRGGQWTYHGPGQIVAYIMLDLTRPHGTVPARDTHAYVEGLQNWLIGALAEFGVQAGPRPGRVGVWVSDIPGSENYQAGRDDKIGAVGVRITRWVSWHGVSLNVRPDLEHFAGIVPCGIREHGVTSLQALGIDVTVEEAQRRLLDCWPGVFGPISSCVASDAALPETTP